MGGGASNQAQSQINTNRAYDFGTGSTLLDNAAGNAAAYGQKGADYNQAADEAYSAVNPAAAGYTPEQEAAITDKSGLAALQTPDSSLQSNYLTPVEQAAERGNPNAGRTSTGDLQSNYLTGYEQAGIRGDQSGVKGALGSVDAAVDPGSVDTFTNNTRLSPADQQLIATNAARSQANVDKSAAQGNVEHAREAGMDPLGVASYSGRANQQSQINQANASTAASVLASNTAAQREQNILSADQTLAAQKADAAKTDLGAQQGMEANASNRAAEIAAARVGTNEANQATTYGQAQTADQTATGRAAAIAGNRQAVSAGNQATKFNQGQYVEGQQSGRATGVANTDLAAQTAATNRGEDYLTSEQTQAQQDALQNQGIQAGVYGTTSGAINGTTNTQVQADSRPAWWQSVLSAGAQVAGAAIPKMSDIRLKENIELLGQMGDLNVYAYNFKGIEGPEVGFMAQEVAKRYPEHVVVGGEDPNTKPWMVNYGTLLRAMGVL